MTESDRLITPEDVERWARERGVAVTMKRTGRPVSSLAAAAAVLGITSDVVARSALMLARDEPVIVVGPASHGVKLPLVAGELGVAGSLVRFAGPIEALRLTGCPKCAMPPFGHTQRMRTLVDEALLAQPIVYALTPDNEVLMQLVPARIVAVTDALLGRFT